MSESNHHCVYSGSAVRRVSLRVRAGTSFVRSRSAGDGVRQVARHRQ